MEGNYKDIESSASRIVDDCGNRTLLVFANNSVGKTTLSRKIVALKQEHECLCFNSFIEETFIWECDFESEEFYLRVNENGTFINDAVINQGLDRRINKIFRNFVAEKIDSNFIIDGGRIQKITFSLVTGDNAKRDNIKISKGEESIFIWSVFCAIAEMALEEKANHNPEYMDLNYIIIDDPVTSLGEENIVSIALAINHVILDKVSELRAKNRTGHIGVLITTHNRLLYNVIFSETRNRNSCLRLSKNTDGFALEYQDDSPFGYHLEELRIIKKVLDSGDEIEKIHFNMFRNVLEKTASFYGYGGSKWRKCLDPDAGDVDEFVKLLNLYSHSGLIDLDDKRIYNQHEKELFKNFFLSFLKNFRWDL